MKWVYDGYTKVHDETRKHMIEKWVYKCPYCTAEVRTKPNRQEIKKYIICPECGAEMVEEGAEE